MLLSLGPPIVGFAASLIVLGLDATFWLISVWSVLLLFFILGFRVYLKRALPRRQQGVVAFFHPNADGGGGGERVLWCGVKAIQEAHPGTRIVIYCADGLSSEQLRRNAQEKFSIRVPEPIEVVQIDNAHLVAPERYPSFTLVGQAQGSVRMAFAALKQLRPQIFIDTSGWAFTYPLARLAGAKVACYVHYPTVSTDMLLRVAHRRPMYNNARAARSLPGALAKLAYYYAFACLYGMAGGCANVVMVNSSWTKRHVRQLWWKLEDPRRVFPPCNTAALRALPLERKLKRLYLVSVAQFRPEKDHARQLDAFALARRRARSGGDPRAEPVLLAHLIFIGSCRGPADRARVDALQERVTQLGLQDVVEFRVNASFDELRGLLAGAVGGLHSMLDEHFGISIVEYMAAGLVPIAHKSGGPREDIVTPAGTSGQADGYLCDSVEEYAGAIAGLLAMPPREREVLAAAARRKSEQFSDALFEAEFMSALSNLLLMLDPAPS